MSEYNRRQVFAAACLGNFIFGIVITTLGTILPSLISRYAVDMTLAGSSLTLMSVGILLGSVTFGPIVDRYGYRELMLGSAGCVAIGLPALAFAPTYQLLLAAVLFVGLGGGVLNGATNALVSDISPGRRSADLSILGIFFGTGAFGIPLVLGFLLDRFPYDLLTSAISLPVLAVLGYLVFVRFPAPKQPRGMPLSAGAGLIKDPVVLLLGAMLFLQSGVEITTSGWTTTFFREDLQASQGTAAFGLSLFWMGMTFARLFLARALSVFSPDRVLLVCLGVAFLGALVVLGATAIGWAYAGLFLLGAGLAAGFPVVLGYAGDLYPTMSGTTFSVLFVMALTGGSILPFLAGVLGSAFGLRSSLLITPASLILIAVLLRMALSSMQRK